MPVTGKTFECLVLEDPDRQWELHDGWLLEKPGMSAEHNWLMFYLGHLLQLQLDIGIHHVRVNAGHLRRPATTYFIPDVAVVPVSLEGEQRGRPLEIYADPLPLVVEFWSPSTGNYDVDTKFAEYRLRGDSEIWRIHPHDRTLRAWRRQPDGSYVETLYQDGTVEPVALPGVTIDLDVLFK